MHYSDESLAELGFYYSMPEPPPEHEIAEADYLAEERRTEQQQAACPHEDTGEEPMGLVDRNGSVRMHLVCYECGASVPTRRYESIL